MGTDVFNLQGVLGLDLSGFQKGLSTAQKGLSKFGKQMQKIGKTLSLKLTAPIAAFGAVAIRTFSKLGDEIAKTSKKIGISTETLSGLKFAAELAGGSFQGLVGGFRRLSSAAFDANAGLAESQRAFDELGVRVANADGSLRSIESIFFEAADALSQMENVTTRAAIAQDIFGRAGLDLIPLLEQGSAAIREQIEEARALGAVFSEEDAKAAEELTDSLLRLKTSLIGVAKTIVVSIEPSLTKFFNSFSKAIASVDAGTLKLIAVFAGLVAAIGPVLIGVGLMSSGISTLILVGKTVIPILTSIALRVAAIVAPVLAAAAAIVAVGLLVGIVIRNWNRLGLAAQQLGSIVSDAFEFIFGNAKEFLVDGMRKVLSFFLAPLKAVVSGVEKFARPIINFFIDIFNNAKKWLIDKFTFIVDGLIDLLNKLPFVELDKFSDLSIDAGQAIGKGFLIMGEGIEDGLEAAVEGGTAALEEVKKQGKLLVQDLQRVGGDAANAFGDELKALGGEIPELIGKPLDQVGTVIKEKFGTGIGALDLGQIIPPEAAQEAANNLGMVGEGLSALDTKLAESRENFLAWFGTMSEGLVAFQELSASVWQQFATGFSTAVAETVVEGQSLMLGLQNVMKGIAKSIIAGLVKIGLERIVQAIATKAAEKASAKASIASGGQQTFAGQFAAVSGAPFPINLTAPAVAAQMLATYKAGVGAAALAEGGIVTGPTLALIGEAGPEKVVPLSREDRRPMTQIISMMLDGREVTRKVVENMPDFLEVELGLEE